MPELPDLTVYQECMQRQFAGQRLQGMQLLHPFLLRTAAPAAAEFHGRKLSGVGRLGKRLLLHFDGGLIAAIHLMRLGRLHCKPVAAKPGMALLVLAFESASLHLSEAGKQRSAALHLLSDGDALRQLDRGGLEPMEASLQQFAAALCAENHTLKRALTDPRVLAGIGNAYSDEILHHARLSLFQQTAKLDPEQMQRLYESCRAVLAQWTRRLRAEAAEGWPNKVTAFRPEMAVHGKYRAPCPACGAPVQRLVYASSEANYCARCQTGGRVLADRALSRLLKANWPRRIEDLEG